MFHPILAVFSQEGIFDPAYLQDLMCVACISKIAGLNVNSHHDQCKNFTQGKDVSAKQEVIFRSG
jgi:hypothetical protein